MIFFSTAIFHVSNVDAFIYLYFVFVRRTVGCAADHVRLLFGRVSVTCSCLIYYIEMILQCADAPRPRQLSTILLQYHFRIKNVSFSIPSDFLQLQATSQNIGTWRFSASNHDFHKYPHLFYSLDRLCLHISVGPSAERKQYEIAQSVQMEWEIDWSALGNRVDHSVFNQMQTQKIIYGLLSASLAAM